MHDARRVSWAALGLALIALTACAPATKLASRPEAAPDTPPIPADPVAAPAVPAAAETPEVNQADEKPARPAAVPRAPLWSRFQANGGFPDCSRLDARAERWLGALQAQSAAVLSDLERAQPLIELVADELERRQVPIAFAMLPMVESRYITYRSSGNRPAGIWQLMPQTARGLAVPMTADYDGRLDYHRATRAAAELLAHLGRQFQQDWRLVDMAFNAGEFRVKSALRRTRQATPVDPDRMGLSRITLHHLAKLEAFSCFVAAGQVPSVAPASARLLPLNIAEPIHVDFLAFVAGVDAATIRRWNPTLTAAVTPRVRGLRVLLPASATLLARTTLRKVPPPWVDWRAVSTRIDAAGARTRYRERAEAVIRLNGLAEHSTAAATRRWLPVHAAAAAPPSRNVGTVHIIRSGESLWLLAKRYGIAIKSLMRWNQLGATSVLRPGQAIRLTPQ